MREVSSIQGKLVHRLLIYYGTQFRSGRLDRYGSGFYSHGLGGGSDGEREVQGGGLIHLYRELRLRDGVKPWFGYFHGVLRGIHVDENVIPGIVGGGSVDDASGGLYEIDLRPLYDSAAGIGNYSVDAARRLLSEAAGRGPKERSRHEQRDCEARPAGKRRRREAVGIERPGPS